MKSHDAETNALKRWFDNFKIDRHAYFASQYETLVVETVLATAKHISKRQICIIENPGYIEHKQTFNARREVIMDHTAPPAPMLTFAAKVIWKPPPPKTPAEIRREQEWLEMSMRGYEPRVRRRPVYTIPTFNAMMPLSPVFDYEEYVDWVPRRSYFSNDMMDAFALSVKKPTPPAPKHRRNV
jgi:hypothetical protein